MEKEENPDKKGMYKNIVMKSKAAIDELSSVLNGAKVPLEQLEKPKQVIVQKYFVGYQSVIFEMLLKCIQS